MRSDGTTHRKRWRRKKRLLKKGHIEGIYCSIIGYISVENTWKIFFSRFVKLLLEVQRCTKVDPPDRVKKESSRGRSAAPRMEEKRE